MDIDVSAYAWQGPGDDPDPIHLADGSAYVILPKGEKKVITEKQYHETPAGKS